MDLTIIGLAVGLSMDAFAVSVTNGLSNKKSGLNAALACGFAFGIFQGLMPLIGYFLGSRFTKYINAYDHWIAFVLLGYIGGKMLLESFGDMRRKKNGSAVKNLSPRSNSANTLTAKKLIIQAIATSIDALAVGVSFAALNNVNIWIPVTVIAAITFIFSFGGVFIGKVFGSKLNNAAQLIGGLILVGIGAKILFEDLFF